MKIAVIGGTSRLGSKVITILKQDAPRTITAAQDITVDTVSDDCLPEGAGVTGDAANPAHAGPGCRGKDCARCSSCAAVSRLTIADPEILRTDETVVLDANSDPRRAITDPEARYFRVRLADLRRLPVYRAIQNAATLSGRPARLSSPHER